MAHPADAFMNNRFLVEIDGLAISDFAEVILPDGRADVAEHRSGSSPQLAHKDPGNVHIGNLVLRRAVTAGNELFNWWTKVADGLTDRRAVAVSLRDAQGQVVKRWAIFRAWPARYGVAPLIAANSDVVLMETLECVAEGFEPTS
jgi:phage tail-like protein